MTRRKIYLLTAIMSAALLGVLIFQFYWIEGVIQVNEQRFSRQVQEALLDVSERLEQEEVAREMLDTTHEAFSFPDNAFSFEFSWRDSLPDQNRIFYFKDDRALNKQENATANKKLKERLLDLQQRRQEYAQQLQEKMRAQERKTEAFIYRFFRQGLQPRQRIDSARLDSLIWLNLHKRGITAAYEYAVFDLNRREVLYQHTPKPQKLLASPYQVHLFPDDFMASQVVLSLHIPNQTRYVLGQMAWPLGLMAFFVLTIIGCFAYAVRIILRQKKLSEMKSDFINNMTHEFKTPIATVRMACEALTDPDLLQQPNIMDRYLGIIRQENQRLGQQVEKVLQIARLEKKALEINYETINLAELIEDVAATYRMRLGEGGSLTISNLSKEPVLLADQLHLTNIVNNLLDNALKYSAPPARISLRLSDAQLRQQQALCLEVTDRGLGISREDIDKIFDKFYRVPTGNVHDVKGFGLGLAYVKYSVEAHGGTITVNSKPNEGSTFRILLPKKPTA